MKRVASPGLMHDTGCLGLVHWDDPEGGYGLYSVENRDSLKDSEQELWVKGSGAISSGERFKQKRTTQRQDNGGLRAGEESCQEG